MKLKKNKKTIIILIIVLVLLLIVNIIMNATTKNTEELSEEELLEKQENEVAVSKLSEKDEQKRIEYYLMEFIEAIEKRNWKKAYEMLYNDFKDNYFSTEDSFKKYCELYFPNMMEVENNNIERINNIYVLETTINDLVNGNKSTGKIGLYFVIRENDLNDFDISFSVNSAIDAKNT